MARKVRSWHFDGQECPRAEMVGRWSTTLLWFSVVMAPAPTGNAGDSVALTLATARIESLPLSATTTRRWC